MRHLFVLIAVAIGLSLSVAGADDAAAPTGPKTFESPEAAAAAIIAVAEKNDDAGMKELAGPTAADLVRSGSDAIVTAERQKFATHAKQKLVVEQNKEGTEATLLIGEHGWPFPVPLIKGDAGWYFDVESGRDEIIQRRIGRNELQAIHTCWAYIQAQVQYAGTDRDGDQVREYAQRVRSTEGKRDGLFWPAGPGEEESPIGPLLAPAVEADGTLPEARAPFGGYYWKILKGQGCYAPGSAHAYVINGNMIAGFALVGVPAQYGDSGIMSFIVSHHGKVFQRDLGESSIEFGRIMMAFDPSPGWEEVTERGSPPSEEDFADEDAVAELEEEIIEEAIVEDEPAKEADAKESK